MNVLNDVAMFCDNETERAAGRGALTDVDASLAAAVLLVFVSRSGMHGCPFSLF